MPVLLATVSFSTAYLRLQEAMGIPGTHIVCLTSTSD
jgi:hypothetical protein